MKRAVFKVIAIVLLFCIGSTNGAVLAFTPEGEGANKEKSTEKVSETSTPSNVALVEQVQVLQDKVRQLEDIITRQQRIIDLWQEQTMANTSATPTALPASLATSSSVDAAKSPTPPTFDGEEQKKLDSLYQAFGQLNLSGDLRFRYDGQFNQGFDSTTASPDRNRLRVRARLQLAGALGKNFDWALRIASNNFVNPNSTNQTFTDLFNRKPVGFDRFFLRYNTKTEPVGVILQAGKFDYPWKRTELTFDNDLQPEGAAETVYYKGKGKLKEIRMVAFQLPFSETSAGKDAYLLGGQLLGTVASGNWAATAATSFLNFNRPDVIARSLSKPTTQIGGGLESGTTNRVRRDAAGNITGFVSNYNILDVIGEVSYNRYPRYPLTVVFNYARNLSERLKNINEEDGYWTEFKVGRLKEKGDWELTYTFARIEQDAILSNFNFDDFLNTNSRNNRVTAGYMVSKNVYLQFLGLFSTRVNTLPGRDSRTQRRFQMDVNYRF